jgi:hypothetical protein
VREATIVADQVDLHEPRLRLIPFGKRAHRNLVLEQRPRLGPAAPAHVEPPPLRGQQPINAGGTDRAQLLPRERLELQFAMPLQHCDRLRHHRRQALAANAIHDHPHALQDRQHRRIVDPQPLPRPPGNPLAPLFRPRAVPTQQPDRIPPVVAGQGDEFVEHLPLLFLARPAIPRPHHPRYGFALLHRQPHLASPTVPEEAFRSDFLDEATNRFHSDF